MVTGAPALVSVDLDHGGRWTSLHVGGREWLWSRDEPLRAHVAPGDPFADAGGIEECVPTVRGRPDGGPYRSIGVEPMLGSVFDLADAREPGDAVTVPRAGYCEWELEIEEVTVDNTTAEAAS
jgi:hypothetical protein